MDSSKYEVASVTIKTYDTERSGHIHYSRDDMRRVNELSFGSHGEDVRDCIKNALAFLLEDHDVFYELLFKNAKFVQEVRFLLYQTSNGGVYGDKVKCIDFKVKFDEIEQEDLSDVRKEQLKRTLNNPYCVY